MQTTTFNAGLAYAEYRQLLNSYRAAALVAFTMSTYFVVGYLAGSLLFWLWDIEQGMNGIVGVGICGVMTAYQFVLYARGDIAGGKKATWIAVCVAVGFSAMSEIGQGMERDHVRMETKSLESPTYKAIVGGIGQSGIGGHPYSTQLASAQMKLARCQQKVSTGIWSDCIESTARLESVQGMISDHYHQNQLSSQAMAETAKAMEKDESNYHPLVNLIKSGLGTTGAIGSFILSMILIGFFEYAFHYLGRQLAASKNLLLKNGYDVTRKKRKIPLAFRVNGNKQPLSPADTWNDELSKTGIDSPTDNVLNQAADPEQMKRIVDRGQSVSNTSGKVSDDRVHTVPNTFKRPAEQLYKIWVKMLQNGDIKPTVRPAREFISKTLCQQIKTETLTPTQINLIATDWFKQAENTGVLSINPDGGVGKPKYLVSGHNPKLGTKEKQLDMHLSGEEMSHA